MSVSAWHLRCLQCLGDEVDADAADEPTAATAAAADATPAESDDDEQYNEPCFGCGCILGVLVGIYNLQKGVVEQTFCDGCGQEMMEEGWVDMDAESDVE